MDNALTRLDWSLIEAFLAVAETGSLSAAARHLGSSQPTLGRQVRQIEDQLGLVLFDRQPRGLKLSESGLGLLEPARSMRDAARRIELAAAGQASDLSGTVRITASVFTAHHLLPPIIAGVRRDYPEIQIDLMPTDVSENLLFREADIAVRMHRSEQLDIVTRHLGDIKLGVYAARAYLDRVGRPQDAEALRQLDFVGYDRSELILRGMRSVGWEVTRDWFATRCDHHAVYYELVRAGCGVGFAQCHVADADPTLEHLVPGFPLPGLPIWLAAHQSLRRSPRVSLIWDRLETGLMPFVS